jgi:alkylhydroperoxidase family enzyme
MALIRTIEPENATGELAELYSQILSLRGKVPNSSKIWSISPELYKQQLSFIGYYMNHKTLSAPLLACIRILVSSETNCKYCVDFNSAMLINMMGWSADEVAELKTSSKSAKFGEKENKILSFVAKSVKNSSKADVNELNELRKLGWDDADILDALQHGARMSAIDIIFNTFDIENDNI